MTHECYTQTYTNFLPTYHKAVPLTFSDFTNFIVFITRRHCHILIFIVLYNMYHLFVVCQTINKMLLLLLHDGLVWHANIYVRQLKCQHSPSRVICIMPHTSWSLPPCNPVQISTSHSFPGNLSYVYELRSITDTNSWADHNMVLISHCILRREISALALCLYVHYATHYRK